MTGSLLRRIAALTLTLLTSPSVLAEDTSTPEGAWHLSSNGQRFMLQLDQHSPSNWSGWINTEGSIAALESINHLEWYPGTRRVVFRTQAGPLWRWYRGHIVEGVFKGRSSDARSSPLQPAVSSFVNHVTGWNASHLDQDIVPRSFDLVIDNRLKARLRIDRSTLEPGQYVGEMKVYASLDNGTLDEGLQYDVHIDHWDGIQLQFQRGTSSDWQVFSGAVSGRVVAGHYFQSDTPEMGNWNGTRAEVLGRGVASDTTAIRFAGWRERTRQQLALLTMARAPASTSTNVSVLQPDLEPLPSGAMHPRRDDNPGEWPRNYRLDELEFEFELPNPYGSEPLTRHAHGYLAKPNGASIGKRPVAVVLNGHGGSAYAMMNPDHPDYWYGDAFARRGYFVLALDISHRDYGDDPSNGNDHHPPIAAEGFSTDWEEDGERAWTVMRAIDYLMTLPDVDTSRIVVAGLSMGGEVASIVGAMDTRVWATIVAGYSPDLNVIRHRDNHPCWQWQWADLMEYIDLSDYQALVSPRLLVAQTGALDAIFSDFQPPFAADKQVARRSRPAHDLHDGVFLHHLHDRGHVFRVGDVAVDGEAAPGLRIPTLPAPIIPWDLTWQTDGQTSALGLNLFELLGWEDLSHQRIFANGFESTQAEAH